MTTPYPRPAIATFALIVITTLAALHEPARAQSTAPAQSGAAPIQILPRPKRVEPTGGALALHKGVRVVLADARSEDDRFAAQDFIDDVQATARVALRVAPKGGRRGVILVGDPGHERVRASLERAGLTVPENLNEEGYVLAVGADEAVVAGRTAAARFYGVQTLKQLVRGEGEAAYVQGVRVVDWPSMRWRALSDDISRGPVPTVEYVKRQLKNEAMFKMNMHSFYMEHAFASKAHPLIGPEGGSLTPEEIREIVAYARRLHIEIVPEQQTFGHLHKALKLEKYNELAEVPYGDVLSPQQEGSYKLVADWYRELDPLFPGKFFHIGADETFELGRGQSSEAVKARGVGAVYFEHLRRVREILQPYNRRLMFWGDIALNHPELIGSVPRDLIVMNWHYDPRESYMPVIKPFKDAGLEQFVCPGVQSWNQVFPNLDAATRNISVMARDGQAAGALGLMNTQWDDDGESLFEMTWYAVLLGAASSWQDAPLDAEAFASDFDWAFFRAEGDSFSKGARALGGVNMLLGVGTTNDLFWRGPFTAQFIEDRVRPWNEKTRRMRLAVEAAEETILRERGRARRNQQSLDSMRFAAQRLDHLGRRMQVAEQLSRDYWEAYLNLGDRRRVSRLLRAHSGAIYNSTREMAEELSVLKESYRREWLKENRPYWLDSVLARYDLAINQWLAKSRALDEALRQYQESSTLPSPEEFGLGERPAENR